jgi:copper chaperone CopZ
MAASIISGITSPINALLKLPGSPKARGFDVHAKLLESGEGEQQTSVFLDDGFTKRVELSVGGMTVSCQAAGWRRRAGRRPRTRVTQLTQPQCGACVASIEGQLSALDGIKSVQVSLLAERAVIVEYDLEFIDAKARSGRMPVSPRRSRTSVSTPRSWQRALF